MEGKNGFALVMVIILIAFLSIVAIGLVALWQGAVNQLVNQEESMQAYYLARSGAAALASWVIAHPSTATSIANIQSQPIHLKKGSVGEVRVMLATSTTNNLTVISTGTVNGAKETLKLTILQGFTFRNPITTNNLTLHGGGDANIKGNILSYYYPTIRGQATIDGTILYFNGQPNDSYNKQRLSPWPSLPLPAAYYSLQSDNTWIFYTNSDFSTTINIPSQTKIKYLYIYAPKASITIIGLGKITFDNCSIVANDLKLDGGFKMSTPTFIPIQFNQIGTGDYAYGSWSY